ncbi:MAG: DUF1501 domain-containing protein [Myxococcota bacterium]
MGIHRRQFLMGLSAGAALAFSDPKELFANQGGEYRALVCLFFLGGLDNYDTIIPYDGNSYNRWSSIRASMLASNEGYRARNTLLPLDVSGFEGRQFALPAEMSGLHGLYTSGKAAIIGNVGPLLEPVTRASFEANTARLPPRLFSHNDQQSTWVSGSPEGGAQYGWGGLFADAAMMNNTAVEFSTITTGGSNLFVTGQQVSPYQITARGGSRRNLFITSRPGGGEEDEESFVDRLAGQPASVRERIEARFQATPGSSNVILGDMDTSVRAATRSNARYAQSSSSAVPLQTVFPGGLGANLRAVANAIAIREQLGVCRQIFMVGLGGFDTHSFQARALPGLQTQISESITAFQAAMEELGVSNQVTLFTASDFGRTLSVNGDGTDHGWGGHSFVVGGAVNGGTIYGQLPVADFGHELDAGNGRLIPSTPVDTFAATLGRWFGLNDGELATALPRWDNSTLGFMG